MGKDEQDTLVKYIDSIKDHIDEKFERSDKKFDELFKKIQIVEEKRTDCEKYNGTEFTGTYDPMASAVFPSEDDVENGVVFGPTGAEYEGNVTLPSENNVRDDILFGASGIEFTGKIVIPDESDVRLSTMFDLSSMGVCRVPPVDKVEDGYMYDDNDSLEGTLSGGSGGNPVLGGHIIRRA